MRDRLIAVRGTKSAAIGTVDSRDHEFHIYDAMIIASGIEARCDTLYSEDMHAGWTHAGLTVVNPFG